MYRWTTVSDNPFQLMQLNFLKGTKISLKNGPFMVTETIEKRAKFYFALFN